MVFSKSFNKHYNWGKRIVKIRITSNILLFLMCANILILGCEQICETKEISLPTIKSAVIETEEDANINGINFFSCVTKEDGYKGKNDH